MAAGLGFKTFATGDVLTAGDTNGYLMQGVWVFADAAARSAAVTSPQEGNISYLKDTNSTEYYSGSAWVAIGAVPSTAGSVYVGGTTFSGSSAVNVNNVFSTTYENYFIVINGTLSSAGANAFIRLRVSGSDDTTANYAFQRVAFYGTGNVTNINSSGQTNWNLTDIANNESPTAMYIYKPFATANTTMTSQSSYGSAPELNIRAGYFAATTSFTGFTLYPSTGTLSGTIRVYGLANS